MQSSLSKLIDNLVEPGKNIPVQVLKERFPNTYKLSHNNDENLNYCCERVFTHMNTCLHGKDLTNMCL